MASTEERIRQLVADNLEVDGQAIALQEDLNVSLLDLGVSSLDLVSFGRVVAREFNVSFTPEDCANVNTVQALVEHVDSQSG